MEDLETRLKAVEDKLDKFFEMYHQSEEDFADSEFKKAHEEQLGPLENKMKALNGDDFDIYKEARAEFKNYPDTDENQFVDTLVETINEEIGKLQEALADGDTAEAAHIAEEVEDKAEQVAETVDDQAHEEVANDDADADAEEPAKEEAPVEQVESEKEPEAEEAVSDEEQKEEPAKEETEDNDEDELKQFYEDLKNSKEYKELHKDEDKDEE